MRRSIAFGLILLMLVAACIPDVPNAPPQVEVAITVVDDQAALDDAVAQALTATQDTGIYATETAYAEAGITLTPTTAPSATLTPSPVPTDTPTVSPTPSETVVPTNTPLPSNTPNPLVEDVPGQIRIIHAWRSSNASAVDVFLDDVTVSTSLDEGDATSYHLIQEDNVRVTLKLPAGPTADFPILDQLVPVQRGSSISFVITEMDGEVTGLVVHEDLAPMATGKARVAVLQANQDLLRVDLVDDLNGLTIVTNLAPGELAGPFDVDTGTLELALLDTELPDAALSFTDSIQLDSHVNYLVVFVPQEEGSNFSSDMLVFESATKLNNTDIPVRFVNAAPNSGPISIMVNNQPLVTRLEVGEATIPLPLAMQGVSLDVSGQTEGSVLSATLGPWSAGQNQSERIFIISDLSDSTATTQTDGTSQNTMQLTEIERPQRVSTALANLRLIHALTGATNTLDLEIRASNPTVIENPIGVPETGELGTDWSKVVRGISFGEASEYVTRAPNRFDARITLSSSGAVQSSLLGVEFLPGAVYDLLVVPGQRTGVTQIVVLEPDPQVSILAMRRDDPQLVEDRVVATLTASAPEATQFVQQVNTPTATISPVPTNTPRPTNTPPVKPPSIQVNPAPPNTVTTSFAVHGESFSPNTRYVVSLDNGPSLLSGRVADDGTIAVTVQVPANMSAGPHVVRVCVDCRTNGAQEEAVAVFIVADPNVSPTPTPEL